MDPLAQAMQLLAEAQQTIQMLAEEVQLSRQNKQDSASGTKKELAKTASIVELSTIFNIDASRLPDFVKEATVTEAQDFYRMVEENVKFSSLGKVAELNEGASFSDPGEALEARLGALIN